MVKLLASLGLLAFVGSAVATPIAAAAGTLAATATAVLPNPTQVFINSISYGGTGCPQGTVGSFISADRQTYMTPNYSYDQ
jgi:hypothetical protein